MMPSGRPHALTRIAFMDRLFCAGIPSPWPTCDHTAPEIIQLLRKPRDSSDEEHQAAALAGLLPSPAERRGCLLADVMGLGKTVSGVCGILLREYVCALAADRPTNRSTLVVCPNDLVLRQWHTHLLAAGFEQNQMLTFRGDVRPANRPQPASFPLSRRP